MEQSSAIEVQFSVYSDWFLFFPSDIRSRLLFSSTRVTISSTAIRISCSHAREPQRCRIAGAGLNRESGCSRRPARAASPAGDRRQTSPTCSFRKRPSPQLRCCDRRRLKSEFRSGPACLTIRSRALPNAGFPGLRSSPPALEPGFVGQVATKAAGSEPCMGDVFQPTVSVPIVSPFSARIKRCGASATARVM